jgi:hypothetical protein
MTPIASPCMIFTTKSYECAVYSYWQAVEVSGGNIEAVADKLLSSTTDLTKEKLERAIYVKL